MRGFTVAILSLFLAYLVSNVVAGSINVTFTTEDPISSNDVIADITLGNSLQGIITLTPAPTKPLRLTIISTVPQIITPTHTRVTVSAGQTSVIFTLISDPFGEIGYATVVVSPELRENQKTYPPTSFDVLVRGFSEADFSAGTECIASGISNEIQLTIDPPAPETVSVVVQVVNGAVTPSSFSIVPGQNTARVQFVGANIGQSSVSFVSTIYETVTLNFTTKGQLSTTNPSKLVANAPAVVVLKSIPSNSADLLVDIVGENMNVPDSVTLSAGASANVGIIPTSSGSAKITYTAANYCDKIDQFVVSPAPLCESGYTANYAGSACIVCPGNNAAIKVFDNACTGYGECTYSGCIQTSSRCICDDYSFGSACQWSIFNTYVQSSLNTEDFNLTLPLSDTLGDSVFDIPADFHADRDVGGSVVIVSYTPSYYDSHYFQNPDTTAPKSTEATETGFYIEVLCADNTNDANSFNSPITVDVHFDPAVMSQNQLGLTSLYYFDPSSRVWVEASNYCPTDEAILNINYIDLSISTTFCAPGQYNFFSSIPSVLPPNTGNPFNPHPNDASLSGSRSTTGVGGVNPINPPLPVFVMDENDPSPPARANDYFANNNFGVSSFSQFSPLLFALVLCFLI